MNSMSKLFSPQLASKYYIQLIRHLVILFQEPLDICQLAWQILLVQQDLLLKYCFDEILIGVK